jgi:deoxyribodipyrimidine photo-lyase
MYWGKQLLRWSASPEQAFRTLLELNDRYFLDGRDPSSFANVAWVFGLHDQAFGERAVSGKTRPMTRAGLDRRLDVGTWLDHVRARLGDVAVDGPGGEASDS